jgi:D123
VLCQTRDSIRCRVINRKLDLLLNLFLTGVSQRDPNYYPFLNENDMGERIVEVIKQLWEGNVKGQWEPSQGNCKSHLNQSYTGLDEPHP